MAAPIITYVQATAAYLKSVENSTLSTRYFARSNRTSPAVAAREAAVSRFLVILDTHTEPSCHAE